MCNYEVVRHLNLPFLTSMPVAAVCVHKQASHGLSVALVKNRANATRLSFYLSSIGNFEIETPDFGFIIW